MVTKNRQTAFAGFTRLNALKNAHLEFCWVIKEFLETNYPRGRAIEVFRSFHFDLLDQKPKFYYLDSRFHGNDNFNGNLDAERRGILFD